MSDIVRVVASTIDGERNAIANMANAAALLYHSMPNVNWAGFYLTDGLELVLGPFQGKVACIRIGHGRGVCGAAVVQKKTMVVPDVHDFHDHIVCDAVSRSEVVVPIIVGRSVVGVLDIDSPLVDRFTPDDVGAFEQIAQLLVDGCDWKR